MPELQTLIFSIFDENSFPFLSHSIRMRLNFDKHFKIKMSDRNFTQRFDVFMTSLSSDNKITVQQCYICGERCDYSLTYLFKQIVSRGWNPIACSG